jgi:hypothetical protein
MRHALSVISVPVEDLPVDRFMFDHLAPNPAGQMLWSTKLVGSIFFGMSQHWMRLQEREGYFVLDGKSVAATRAPTGIREYNLHDIEMIAHALRQQNRISVEKLVKILRVCRAVGDVNGLLAPEDL